MKLHLPKPLRNSVLACIAAVAGIATPTLGTATFAGGVVAFTLATQQAAAATYLEGDNLYYIGGATQANLNSETITGVTVETPEGGKRTTVIEEIDTNGKSTVNIAADSNQNAWTNAEIGLLKAQAGATIDVMASNWDGNRYFDVLLIEELEVAESGTVNFNVSKAENTVVLNSLDGTLGTAALTGTLTIGFDATFANTNAVSGTGTLTVVNGATVTINTSGGTSGVTSNVQVGAGSKLVLAQGDALGWGTTNTKSITLLGSGTDEAGQAKLEMSGKQTMATNLNLSGNGVVTGGQLEFLGGRITATGTNNVIASDIYCRGGQDGIIEVTGAADVLKITGTVKKGSQGEGPIIKEGEGQLILSGAENIFYQDFAVKGGTVTLSNTTTMNGSLTLHDGATLETTVDSAITFGSNFKIDLSNLTAVAGEGNVMKYTILTGSGNKSLETLNAGNISGILTMGKLWTFGSDGSVSYVVTTKDLVWDGTSGSVETWSTSDTQFSSGGEFANGDNVTFAASASVSVAQGGVQAMNMIVQGEGTHVRLLTAEGITLGEGLTVKDGAILELATSSNDVGVLRGVVTVEDGGTLRFSAKDVTGWGDSGNITHTINVCAGGTLEMTHANNETFRGALNLDGTVKGTTASASLWDLFGGKATVNVSAGATAKMENMSLNLRQDNSVVTVGEGGSLTIEKGIKKGDAGNAVVIKEGAGALIVQGESTNSGFTVNGGSVEMANTNDLTMSISGVAGTSFTKNGAGVINMGNIKNYSYAGEMIVNDGEIKFTSDDDEQAENQPGVVRLYNNLVTAEGAKAVVEGNVSINYKAEDAQSCTPSLNGNLEITGGMQLNSYGSGNSPDGDSMRRWNIESDGTLTVGGALWLTNMQKMVVSGGDLVAAGGIILGHGENGPGGAYKAKLQLDSGSVTTSGIEFKGGHNSVVMNDGTLEFTSAEAFIGGADNNSNQINLLGGTIKVSASDVTLAGSAQHNLTMGGIDIDVASGKTATLGGTISLSSTIEKTGSGTLKLDNGVVLSVDNLGTFDRGEGSTYTDFNGSTTSGNGFFTGSILLIAGDYNKAGALTVQVGGTAVTNYVEDSTGLGVSVTDNSTYFVNTGTVTLTESKSVSAFYIASGAVLAYEAGDFTGVVITGSGVYDIGSNYETANRTGVTNADAWTGTVRISNATVGGDKFFFNNYGNVNSALELVGVSGWLPKASNMAARLLLGKDTEAGLNGINVTAASDWTHTFSGGVAGEGDFLVSRTGGGNPDYVFRGDMSGWTGAFRVDNESGNQEVIMKVENTGVDTTVNAGVECVRGNLTLEVAGSNGKAVFNKAVNATTLKINGHGEFTKDVTLSGDLKFTADTNNHVVFHGTNNIVNVIDLSNGNAAAGILELKKDAKLTSRTTLWMRPDASILLEEGASVIWDDTKVTGKAGSVAEIKASANASQWMDTAGLQVKDAMFEVSKNETRTVAALLQNSSIINSGTALVTVTNAANTLTGVEAKAGNIVVQNAASLAEVSAAAGKTVTAEMSMVEMNAITLGAGSKFEIKGALTLVDNAVLTLGEGAAITMNGALTLGTGLTLDIGERIGDITLISGITSSAITEEVAANTIFSTINGLQDFDAYTVRVEGGNLVLSVLAAEKNVLLVPGEGITYDDLEGSELIGKDTIRLVEGGVLKLGDGDVASDFIALEAIEGGGTILATGSENVVNFTRVAIADSDTLSIAGTAAVGETPAANLTVNAGTVSVGSGSTIQVGSSQTLNTTGDVTIGSTATLNVATDGLMSVGGAIVKNAGAESATLTKSGGGKLVIGGTLDGTVEKITVQGGTLELTGGGNITGDVWMGKESSYVVFGGEEGTAYELGGILVGSNNAITGLSGNSITVDSGVSVTVKSTAEGGGTSHSIKCGWGLTTLDVDGTLTLEGKLENGTRSLSITGDGTVNAADLVLSAGATFSVHELNVSGNISGTNTLQGGTLNVSGNISGTNTLQGGTLNVIGATVALNDGLNVRGGTLKVSSDTVFSLNSDINISGGTASINGALNQNNNSIVVSGGTFTLATTSTYASANNSNTIGRLEITEGAAEGAQVTIAGSGNSVGLLHVYAGNAALTGKDITVRTLKTKANAGVTVENGASVTVLQVGELGCNVTVDEGGSLTLNGNITTVAASTITGATMGGNTISGESALTLANTTLTNKLTGGNLVLSGKVNLADTESAAYGSKTQEITYKQGTSGLKRINDTYTVVDGEATLDDTGAKWFLNGTAITAETGSYADGALTVYGSYGTAYWVNGTDTVYITNPGDEVSDALVLDTAAQSIALNGGTLVLNTDTELGITRESSGIIEITDEVTLSSAQLVEGTGTATLKGQGTYDLGSALDLSEGVSLMTGEGGWSGTVRTAASGVAADTTLNLGSKVEFTADTFTAAGSLTAEDVALSGKSLTLQGASNTVGALTLTGDLTLGTEAVASKLTVDTLDITGKVVVNNLAENLITAGLVGSLKLSISDDVLRLFAKDNADGSALTLATIEGLKEGGSVLFNGESLANKYSSTDGQYAYQMNIEDGKLTLSVAVNGTIWGGDDTDSDINWNTASNWQDDDGNQSTEAPGAGDSVRFTGQGSSSVVFSEASAINNITIDASGKEYTFSNEESADAAGFLELKNNLTIKAGTLNVAMQMAISGYSEVGAGGALNVLKGGNVVSLHGFTNTGVIEVADGGTFSVGSAGIATEDGGAADVSLHTLVNNNQLTNKGSLTVLNELINTGEFRNEGNGVFSVYGNVTNTKDMSVAGGLGNACSSLTNSGDLSISKDATLYVGDGVPAEVNGVSVADILVNSGTITLGSAAVEGEAPEAATKGQLTLTGDLTNTGTVTVLTEGSALAVTGAVVNNAGGSIAVSNGSFSAASVDNADKLTISGGAASITGALANSGAASISAGSLTAGSAINSGTIAVTGGTVTINGALANTGTATVEGGTVTLGSLDNDKTMTVSGGSVIAGSVDNATGATIEVTGGSLAADDMTNGGALSIAGGSVTVGNGSKDETTGELDDALVNTGTITVGADSSLSVLGNLSHGGSGDIKVNTGATLDVLGDLSADGMTLDFDGKVTVGGDVTIKELTINTGADFTANGTDAVVDITKMTNNGTLSVGTVVDNELTGGNLIITELTGTGNVNVGKDGTLTIKGTTTDFEGTLNNQGQMVFDTENAVVNLKNAQKGEDTAGDITAAGIVVTDAAVGADGGSYVMGNIMTDELSIADIDAAGEASRLQMESLAATTEGGVVNITITDLDVETLAKDFQTLAKGNYNLITMGGTAPELNLTNNDDVTTDDMQTLLANGLYIELSPAEAAAATFKLTRDADTTVQLVVRNLTLPEATWTVGDSTTRAGLIVLNDSGELKNADILDYVRKVEVAGDQTIDLTNVDTTADNAVQLNGLTGTGNLTVQGTKDDYVAINNTVIEDAEDPEGSADVGDYTGKLILKDVNAGLDLEDVTVDATTADTTITGSIEGGSLTVYQGSTAQVGDAGLALTDTTLNVVIEKDFVAADGVIKIDQATLAELENAIADLGGDVDADGVEVKIGTLNKDGVLIESLGYGKYFDLNTLRVESNGVVLADRNTSYYSKALTDAATSENGAAGLTLADAALLNLNPQGQAATGDLAAVLDQLDRMVAAGDTQGADELGANLAGASTAVLGMAAVGDVDRQLRAIRNRTTTMGVDQTVVNHDMPYFNAWINAEGHMSEMGDDGTLGGYKLNSWGGTVGFDVDIDPTFTAGLALTAMYGDLDATGADKATGNMDTTYVSAFARYCASAWTHTFVATAGMGDISLDRTVNGTQIKGETESMSFGLMYEVGRVFALDEDATACIQPVFNVAWRHASVDGYTEKGSDVALEVGEQSLDTITFGLGARVQAVVGESMYNRTSIFECRLLAKADVGDRESAADVALGGGKAEVKSAETGAFGLEAGAGLTIPLGDEGSSIFMDASVELRADYTNVNGTVGYRINF